jgi:ABC-type uncharacterized transport system substrate-binding protein
MLRRGFLLGVVQSGLAFSVSRGARAQPASGHPPARVGCLFVNDPGSPLYQAFFDAVRQQGLIDGANVVIIRRFAAGNSDALPGLAAELVAMPVDVIVTSSTPAVRAAQAATTTIPIVAAIIGDPVAEGFGTSLARPTGNVTGGSLIDTDIVGKRLELLKEAVPALSRVAVLVDESLSQISLPRAEVSHALGVEMHIVKVTGGDFGLAFADAVAFGAQGVLAGSSVFFNSPSARTKFAELCLHHRLPGSFDQAAFVEDGCLMSYGPDFSQMFRQAASYVEKILKGAKPADLPFEQPTKFIVAINLKTAKALGLTVPQSILARADEVIE